MDTKKEKAWIIEYSKLRRNATAAAKRVYGNRAMCGFKGLLLEKKFEPVLKEIVRLELDKRVVEIDSYLESIERERSTRKT